MKEAHEHHQKLAKRAGIFTGGTLVSRILGYLRDSVVANFFGAGVAADAFYAAFRISNLFRRLLGEGALSASFIPVFSEYSEKHGKEETQAFFNTMFTTLLAILLTITVLGIVFAPQITSVIAMGFERTPDRFDLTVSLTRYMFPFLMFISLAALITGVLNSFHSFFLPALAPACLSIAEIAYIYLIAPYFPLHQQVIGLAISVTVGGFSQFFIHIPALLRKGYHLALRWDPVHPGVRRVGKLILPATLGLSVDQLNAFVDTMCASFLKTGSVTALYYSNRVMQLPLALFGIALSQVALPAMSAHAAKGENEQVKDTLNFSLRLTLFMILPATVGLIVMGHPIVQVLFQHGKFDAEATDMTTWALLFFSLGLTAYASVKILASAFYAYQNTRTPVIIAAVCVAINVGLSITLMRPMGVGGLALATATASWANAGLLFWQLRKRVGLLGGRRLFVTFTKSMASSAVMAAWCYATLRPGVPFGPVLLRLILGIGGGAAIYFAFAWLLKMEEWKPFWSMMYSRRSTERVS